MQEFFKNLISTWWGVTIIVIACAAVWLVLSVLLYKPFFKRFYDIVLSGLALIVLSPILLILIILGAIKMGGNPFFTQSRPGKKEKIFRMLKFRTMTNKKDSSGNLLPDSDRLTKYGKILRASSLDELPELINIFIGQMSIVGPRPLLVQYLPLYNESQKKRHAVRPGLTGLAQVSGRNAISWEQKFDKDLEYISKITLLKDVKILVKTVAKIFKREGINQAGDATMEFFTGNIQKSNIFILSSGRRVELVKAFKAAISKLNTGAKVVAADNLESAPSLYFADKYFIVPRISDESYIPSIIKICQEQNISLIVPTIDTELLLLAKSKELIESSTTAKVLISDEKYIEICRNKIMSSEFFDENGFAVPKTLSKQDIDKQNYSFPLFIKPLDGSSSVNAFKVDSKKQLDFFIDYIANPIIQECITGTEYTVDVFSDFDGNVITIVPRKRLATRSGEILKGQIDKNRIIIEDVKRLMTALKTIGHITIQGFLGEDNIFRYIEVNPRFGGGAPMSFMAGANSAENLIKLLSGEKLVYNEDYRDNIVLSRFDDCIEIRQ